MLFGARKTYRVETLGSSALRQVAAPIPEVTPEIRRLAEEMLGAMIAFEGIGLAAPQVGRALRLVVLGVPPESMEKFPTPGELELLPRMPLVLVNPEIVSYDDSVLVERDEGCLSLPDLFAPVVRPHRVVLRSGTLDGGVIQTECGGLLARCLQHELDHLDGVLFVDRVAPPAQEKLRTELRRLQRFGEKHEFKRTTRR